jgi:hypothetical protein
MGTFDVGRRNEVRGRDEVLSRTGWQLVGIVVGTTTKEGNSARNGVGD